MGKKKPDLKDYLPSMYKGGVIKYLTEYTGGSIRHKNIRALDVQQAMHDMERDVRRFAQDLEAWYISATPQADREG